MKTVLSRLTGWRLVLWVLLFAVASLTGGGCATSGPRLSGMPAAGPPEMQYAEVGDPR